SLDQRQGIEANSIAVDEWVAQDIHRVDPTLESRERGREILGSPDFERGDVEAEGLGRCLNWLVKGHGRGQARIMWRWRLGPARFGSYFGGCFSIYRTSSIPAVGLGCCDRCHRLLFRIAHYFLDGQFARHGLD